MECWVDKKRNVSQFYCKNDFIPILRPIIPVFQSSNIPEHNMLQNFDLFEVCSIDLYVSGKVKILFAVQDIFYLNDQFAIFHSSV